MREGLTVHTTEAEHSNLGRDVIPPVRSDGGRVQLVDEEVVQDTSHLDDAPCHAGDIRLPLRKHSRVVQDH